MITLSGLRLNEAQGIPRNWVSDDGYVSYPDTKGGAQIRVIGRPALAVICNQPVVAECPHVFPSDGGQMHFIASDGLLGRICRRLGFDDVTAHTLRHTFGSIAGELGYSELTIAAMFGHAAGSVTGRYVHIDEAVRSAVERVSGEIAMLLDEGDANRAVPCSVFSFSSSLVTAGLAGHRSGLVTVRAAAVA